jgi:transposase
MLHWTVILGGLRLMMGRHSRAESLFYYFRIEDQVPENHLLRLIDRHVSFEFVRETLRDSYSETGRPSIDPEVLLRILLLGYLYGITSERRLVDELRMHLAWRWFTGLGFDQEIPDHSTFSKNRHGRFQESNLFQELFERIVDQCIRAGLVKGENMSVDGSLILANADNQLDGGQFCELLARIVYHADSGNLNPAKDLQECIADLGILITLKHLLLHGSLHFSLLFGVKIVVRFDQQLTCLNLENYLAEGSLSSRLPRSMGAETQCS